MWRGRTVALLGGWLLMQPPPIGYVADVTAWEQLSAYDTAALCERGRAALVADARRFVKADKGGKDPKRIAQAQDAFSSLQARCVPAEYIYPPKQAAEK